MLITQAPKGTQDVLPGQSAQWQRIEEQMRRVCALFGYGEVRVPTFEHTELFLRGVGSTTDIVQKEMYTFTDKGDRSITLKPEGTAGVARAFVEHKLYAQPLPQKMYYLYSPVFRYEKPQAGRFREHHQFGVEVFGAPEPSADAEVISLALSVLSGLGLGKMSVHVNSIGCPVCRPDYQRRLTDYFRSRSDSLCKTCLERLDRNPLRVLDCKEEGCQAALAGAPSTVDCLCGDCQAHFNTLLGYLEALGIDAQVDPRIVRGLDYYTKTVFEIIATEIGAQSTVCGGGRYDGLMEEIGGPAMAGMGFGMGMERLLLLMEKRGIAPAQTPPPAVFLAPMGDAARKRAVEAVAALRQAGVSADMDHGGRSLKAQLKYADRLGSPYVVVLGEDELSCGQIKIRDMARSSEQPATLSGLTADILRLMEEKEGK